MSMKPYPFHGFNLFRQKDSHLGDGRRKTALYLRDVETGKTIAQKDVRERKGEVFEDTVAGKAAELVLSQRDVLLQLARDGKFPRLKLESYLLLRWEDIRVTRKWAGKVDVFRANWEGEFGQRVGGLCLFDEQLKDRLETIVESLTSRQKNHREYSEEERNYWRFLGNLLDEAVQDGLLPENPVKNMLIKSGRRESGTALRNLAKRSFSDEEFARLVEACVNTQDAIHRAVLLRAFTGVTVSELCGLNIGDVKRAAALAPTGTSEASGETIWIEISRVYSQKQYCEPQLSSLLPERFCYRRIPCPQAVGLLLSQQIRERKKEGATTDDALFVADGKCLTPNAVKELENKLAELALVDPINLPFGRGSKWGRFRGDLLRANATYHFRETCRLNESEIAAVLGTTPPHTYASSYVDWTFPIVQAYLCEKMERWCGRFLRVDGCGCRAEHTSPIVSDTLIQGTATRDFDITLSSGTGLDLYVGGTTR